MISKRLLPATTRKVAIPWVDEPSCALTADSETYDETALIRAARAGDADAFVALVRHIDNDMRALAFSMTGSPTSMDDVLQDAYLKAFRSIGNFNAHSSFKTWIWRIVHNSAMDENRRHSHHSSRVDPLPLTSIPSEAAQAVDVPLRLDIDAALQKLPAELRIVVLMIDGEGYDYKTTADLLGIPTGTVSSRINQARKVLRELLAFSQEGGQQ